MTIPQRVDRAHRLTRLWRMLEVARSRDRRHTHVLVDDLSAARDEIEELHDVVEECVGDQVPTGKERESSRRRLRIVKGEGEA